MAMITLAAEVVYYKKRNKKIEDIKNLESKKTQVNVITRSPPTITIGDTFLPVKGSKLSKVAHFDLYPKARNTITKIN